VSSVLLSRVDQKVPVAEIALLSWLTVPLLFRFRGIVKGVRNTFLVCDDLIVTRRDGKGFESIIF
jgi:hypothetical protein